MKDLLIIANWKSNMMQTEADKWIEDMKQVLSTSEKKIVICPPFTLLPLFSQKGISPSFLGAQTISSYDPGAYTGEVNGIQIREFAQYVIIGHSERRTYCKEDDEMLEKKVIMAKINNLIPIFCVQGKETLIPEGVEIVAYEPVWAIGTGKAESPEEANEVAKKIKEKYPVKSVLYGGSVTENNVQTFTQMNDVDGVLVGGASLDPQKFSQIISHA